jgi:hypothetical protein
MLRDKMKIKGKVKFTVRTKDGKIKRFEPKWWQNVLNLRGSLMIVETNNIITDEGDALIADQMSETPARTKVDNTNGYIEVGTGFTSEIKSRTSCTTPTGSPKGMEATYPKQKGAFGAADDNVTQYRALFTAGLLNATVDEAALMNNAVAASGDCLAYAEISPALPIAVSDTLQIDWEVTYIGS